MKFNRFVIFTCILLFLGHSHVTATHLVGAEITYKQLDSLRFKIDLIFYRDCRGVPFGNPSSETKLRCGSTAYNVTLTAVKIDKLITGSDSFCMPQNTYNTGGGIERHYYTATINFGDSYYKAAYNCATDLIIETGQCCRSSGILTGLANTNFYNYAILNLKKSGGKNSSPVFMYDPVMFRCCNNPSYSTFTAIDSIDGDSLSYHFAHPKENYTSNISYNSGYSYDNPFKSFYPGTTKFPYNNPNANPPAGIFLDPISGILIFTPVKCDEVTVVVLEVREWRRNKDSANRYVQIGAIRRDIMQVITSCNSKTPIITPQGNQYFICEDSTLCIDITSKDHSSSDSVKMNVTSDAPGATVNYIYNGLVDTARFCYTLKKDHLSDLPFTITVQARNNGKPYYGYATNHLRISSKSYSFNSSIERIICNQFKISSIFDSSLTGPVFSWKVFDEQFKRVNDTSVVVFSGTGSSESYLQSDKVQFKTNGKYYIEQVFQASKSACISTKLDSVIIQNADLLATLNFSDTIMCAGDTLVLFDPENNRQKLQYSWSEGHDTNVISTDTILSWIPQAYRSSQKIKLQLSDDKGCFSDTSIKISTHPEQRFIFESGYFACEGDTLKIPTGHAHQQFIWSNGVTSNTGMSLKSEKINVRYKDSLQCTYFDTVTTEFFKNPELNLADLSSCDSVKVVLNNFASVLWSDSGTNSTFSTTKPGKYWVWVKDYFQCESSDTFLVKIFELPVIELGRDTTICTDSIRFDIDPALNLIWNTGATASAIKVASSQLYILTGTDSHSCSGRDSIYITKLNPPSAPKFTTRGDTLFSDKTGYHDWFRDGTLIASGNLNYQVMNVSGYYSATFRDSMYCESDRSDEFSYKVGYVTPISLTSFRVFPNPNKGVLSISGSIDEVSNIGHLRLTDLSGRMIEFASLKEQDQITLYWPPVSGVLLLQVHLKSGEIFFEKILVR